MKKNITIKILLTFSLVFEMYNGQSQTNCIKHWSANKSQIVELDSIFVGIDKSDIDTIYCDSFTVHSTFNCKWYINFYNKHFGNYFSNPKSVCFGVFYYKQKEDSILKDIQVIQFVLNSKQINSLKLKYGQRSAKMMTYVIEPLVFYKHAIKGNTIYFISTDAKSFKTKNHILFERIFNQIAE